MYSLQVSEMYEVGVVIDVIRWVQTEMTGVVHLVP